MIQRTVKRAARVVLTFLSTLALHVHLVRAHGTRQMTYIVQHSERTCFSNVWTDSQKVFFEYQVIRGGNKDVDVQIITPNGMVLYDRERATGDEVTFTPQNGEFKFCFSNEFSQISDKVVVFNIRPAYTGSLSQEAGNREPTVKQAGPAACDEIHEAFTAVTDFQNLSSQQIFVCMNFEDLRGITRIEASCLDDRRRAHRLWPMSQRKYRVREAIGRHLAERLNKMVSWWSMGQTVVVMLCGVGQVIVLRMFFMDKRKSSKPAEGEPEEKQVITYT